MFQTLMFREVLLESGPFRSLQKLTETAEKVTVPCVDHLHLAQIRTPLISVVRYQQCVSCMYPRLATIFAGGADIVQCQKGWAIMLAVSLTRWLRYDYLGQSALTSDIF